ncbi:MAG: hypothetical protein HYW49_06705 [Deltaproteobacteria bacterium]|nr:hypothetical protein [Deltaproteobacteria bacterium]
MLYFSLFAAHSYAQTKISGSSPATALTGAKLQYTGPIFVVESGKYELWFSKGEFQSGFDFFTLDYYTRCRFFVKYKATSDDQQVILSSDAGIELEIADAKEYRDDDSDGHGVRFTFKDNELFEDMVCFSGTALGGCGFGEMTGTNLKVKNVQHQLGKYFKIVLP